MDLKMKKSLFLVLFTLFTVFSVNSFAASTPVEVTEEKKEYESKSLGQLFDSFYSTTGLKAILEPQEGLKGPHGEELTPFAQSFGRIIMFGICFMLFYLAIAKGFEPLLLIPIGFGGILANIPVAEIAGENGMLGIIYNMGISNGFFPLMIFMGVGAMTDFGPLLSNPKTALLGGAAQFGIFGSLVGAIVLSQYVPGIEFSLEQAAAISIIGGADGPTSIFIATALAPELLGAIAVAAYSYMALVPVIQPPIMRALTTMEERKIKMKVARKVTKLEKITFPILVVVLAMLILPDAAPLIGAFCFGNFAKESGVVDRLSDTMQNALINIVTILAFAAGTATGVLMAKLMNLFMSKENKINPLIGAAGVSAVPMAARVVSKEGQRYDSSNILLMHAMGPNVAGVIGSAVAAGVLISIFK
jgi:oxaloacetate decarboxylase beta subunit